MGCKSHSSGCARFRRCAEHDESPLARSTSTRRDHQPGHQAGGRQVRHGGRHNMRPQLTNAGQSILAAAVRTADLAAAAGIAPSTRASDYVARPAPGPRTSTPASGIADTTTPMPCGSWPGPGGQLQPPACGVQAGRRPPEGLGLDTTEDGRTLLAPGTTAHHDEQVRPRAVRRIAL